MEKVNESIVELNRRLLHRQPRLPVEDTLNSPWFNGLVPGYDHENRLRLLARICRISKIRLAEEQSEKALAAKRAAFTALGTHAADVLYTHYDGPDKRPFAAKLFASVLTEAKTDPVLEDAMAKLLKGDGRLRILPVDRASIESKIYRNTYEPWRHSAWDHAIRPHMLAMAGLVKAAPSAAVADQIAERALVVASASLTTTTGLILKSDTEGFYRSQDEFGGKPLVTHIADSVAQTAAMVLSAYSPESANVNVRHALLMQKRVERLRDLAEPKLEACRVQEAEQQARRDALYRAPRTASKPALG